MKLLSTAAMLAAITFLSNQVLAQQFGFTYNDSITVLKGGDTLTLAWGGGLNYPQFSDFDYDFDGDLDLFVFDRSTNNPRVFTNEGGYYKHAYGANAKFPPDLRYRATMIDYDADGRKDLFTHGIGGLRVFRNVGDITNGIQWVLVKDPVASTYPGGTSNLYVSSSDIPAIEDVDGDGDYDILTFAFGGTHVEYHKNLSIETYGIPDSLLYELKNECWGKFSEDPTTNAIILNDPNVPCVGGSIPSPEIEIIENRTSRNHSGSTLLAMDYDNSGVMDLIIGDVSYPNLNLLINGGSAPNMDSPMISADPSFPSNSSPADIEQFPASFWVDVDFDGIKDLLVCPNAKNVSNNERSVWYYQNIQTNALPLFVFNSKDFMQNEMIEHGTGSVPVLTDINEDGLEDLIVANFYRYKDVLDKESTLAYYQNTGTASDPEFTFIDGDYLNLTAELWGLRCIPTFGDLDADGDNDLLLGVEDGTIVYYENTSTGSGAVYSIGFPNYQDYLGVDINSGGFAHPQLFDLNGDTLLDLLVGTRSGEIMYYKNIGTLATPSFELITPTLGNVDVSTFSPDGYAAPHFFRDSGEVHLFVGSLDGNLSYYNDITANLNPSDSFNLVSDNYLGINVEGYSSFFINDLNNNGLLNMFVGQDLGGVFHFEADPNSDASLNELLPAPNVAIYPNPVDNLLTISSEDLLDFYTITDMKGAVISTHAINGKQTTVDVQPMARGFYLIQIHLEDGRVSVKKIVKR